MGDMTRRRYWKRVEVMRNRKRRALRDVKRAEQTLERNPDDGQAAQALAHAEGRLRGLKEAEKLHGYARELIEGSRRPA